ncbi:hydroxylacyl-CoA dehydrogenase [Streptomyces sp. NPDC002677]|uniref:hydroxylacyl-CoA dehydrogenase n=1 Tax=Streptomyces sp. NPDC002677 TaxID=3154774 RepID=UPI00331EFD7D
MDRYLTVAEVTDSARRLVSRFPGTGRLRRIGTSRAGRPILMLSVGHGPHHVLVVARPHPDEPVGGTTAIALAEHVASGLAERGASVLAERGAHGLAERGARGHQPPTAADPPTATDPPTAADPSTPTVPSTATDPSLVTWDIVLCLDPDGAALSQGIEEATARPRHTLADYYRAAYRPVAAEQPEWAPIESRHLPESQALFDVIDELRPVLQCSLHNVDAGGTWVQLTRDLPRFAAPFRKSAAELAIPVQYGTFDALYWENPGPGVYVLPPPQSAARLAAGSENIGLSTWCAPARYGGVTAIIEVPLWATDLADDPSPRPDAGAVLRDLAGLVRDGGRQVTAVLDKARPFLPPARDNAPRRVLEWMADGLYDLVADSWEPLAREAADGPPGLTTAQLCALDIVARRQPLRAAGLLLRLLETADDPAAPGLRRDLDDLFTTWCADFEKTLHLRRVPVRQQVAHQTRTILAAAESALTALR